MNKLTTFINLLKDILLEIDKERKNIESLWHINALDNVVKPEINKLLEHAQSGEVYFKYGKKQRMLESTYYITDTFDKLDDTNLGIKIFQLQELYRRL